MTSRRAVAAGVLVAVLLVVAVGCTSSQRRSINEAVARNTVAVAGAKEFRDHDHAIDGLLTCRTKSRTTTKVVVTCDGRTEKDEPVSLLGATSDARQVKGTFVGTVAGTKLFETDCLGC